MNIFKTKYIKKQLQFLSAMESSKSLSILSFVLSNPIKKELLSILLIKSLYLVLLSIANQLILMSIHPLFTQN